MILGQEAHFIYFVFAQVVLTENGDFWLCACAGQKSFMIINSPQFFIFGVS